MTLRNAREDHKPAWKPFHTESPPTNWRSGLDTHIPVYHLQAIKEIKKEGETWMCTSSVALPLWQPTILVHGMAPDCQWHRTRAGMPLPITSHILAPGYEFADSGPQPRLVGLSELSARWQLDANANWFAVRWRLLIEGRCLARMRQPWLRPWAAHSARP